MTTMSYLLGFMRHNEGTEVEEFAILDTRLRDVGYDNYGFKGRVLANFSKQMLLGYATSLGIIFHSLSITKPELCQLIQDKLTQDHLVQTRYN